MVIIILTHASNSEGESILSLDALVCHFLNILSSTIFNYGKENNIKNYNSDSISDTFNCSLKRVVALFRGVIYLDLVEIIKWEGNLLTKD
jgi:hypothetical protein